MSNGPGRLETIDRTRGIAVLLMTVDHAREAFMANPLIGDPIAPGVSDSLFLTRWVTHICAPTFALLAGMSLALMAVNLRMTPGRTAKVAFVKGAGLIALEALVVSGFWRMSWPPDPMALGVLWALGAGFLALGFAAFLPRSAMLPLGLAAGASGALSNVVHSWPSGHLGHHAVQALFVSGVPLIGGAAFVHYPPIPWIGVMLLGYWLGGSPWIGRERSRVRAFSAMGAASLAAAAGLVAAAWLYGRPPGTDVEPLWRAALNAKKYPPSPTFLTLTLALSFFALAAFERRPKAVPDVLGNYGRAPLAYYVAHLALLFTLAWSTGLRTESVGGVWAIAFGAATLLYPTPHVQRMLKTRKRQP